MYLYIIQGTITVHYPVIKQKLKVNQTKESCAQCKEMKDSLYENMKEKKDQFLYFFLVLFRRKEKEKAFLHEWMYILYCVKINRKENVETTKLMKFISLVSKIDIYNMAPNKQNN